MLVKHIVNQSARCTTIVAIAQKKWSKPLHIIYDPSIVLNGCSNMLISCASQLAYIF